MGIQKWSQGDNFPAVVCTQQKGKSLRWFVTAPNLIIPVAFATQADADAFAAHVAVGYRTCGRVGYQGHGPVATSKQRSRGAHTPVVVVTGVHKLDLVPLLARIKEHVAAGVTVIRLHHAPGAAGFELGAETAVAGF